MIIQKLKQMKKEKILFWIIMIIGILVRIYHFPTALQEMNSDEIMTAVNAKSIADTGMDLNHISFPVYLQGWGGQSVILLYLMTLSIKLFGYSLLAVRLPTLIISIISLFVFYDLVKKISNNKKIALIGLALVCISPWHILQSIWALDCNMFPHFLLFAMDLFYTGLLRQKSSLLYSSMALFAISLYGYGVAIYFVPLFLLVMCIYLLKIKRIRIKDFLICLIIFLVLAMPIILMFTINVLHTGKSITIGKLTIPYYEGLSRTNDMIFFAPNPLEQLVQNIRATGKVILFQTDGAEWNSSKPFGTTYPITIIFMLIGLAYLIKKSRQEKHSIHNVMIISWFLISLLTGLIINQANINRLNSLWYVFFLLAALGINHVYEKINHKQVYQKIVIGFYLVIFTSFTLYFYGYYTDIVDHSGCFSRGFYETLTSVKTLDKSTIIWYDNLKDDGCLKLYINLNHDNSKQYLAIKNENELTEKMNNLAENELVIVDVEFKQYENTKNSYQIGDFLIITP